jgi:hypothetical protein
MADLMAQLPPVTPAVPPRGARPAASLQPDGGAPAKV